jgi:hypothetical protein
MPLRATVTAFTEINRAFKRFVHQRRIIRNRIITRRLADDLLAAQSVDEAWPLLRRAARQLGFSYVELKGRRNGDCADAIETGRYAQHLCPETQSASETSIAVALTSARGALGWLILSRSATAVPLESELPLLINAVAYGLPRVLENGENSSPMTSPARWQEHDKSEIDAQSSPPTRVGCVRCPSCASSEIHRSRARSRVERMRKNLTEKRLHECGGCGWRGWRIPLVHARKEQAVVTLFEPPDLQAIDIAIASARSVSAIDSSRTLRLDFRQTTGRARHAPNRGI